MVILVSPNKLAPDGMVGVSVLADRFFATVKKVNLNCLPVEIGCLYRKT